MTNREKIIVGAMCLTVLYGAYELLGTRGAKKSAPAPQPQANQMDETRKFVTEMTQKMVSDRLGKEDQHMVNQAASEWTKDPLLQSITPIDAKAPAPTVSKQPTAKAAPSPAFAFTGFLRMGDTQLAIINGMEYAVGDTIDTNGNFLESISPAGVVIGAPNGEKIQLPLSEID